MNSKIFISNSNTIEIMGVSTADGCGQLENYSVFPCKPLSLKTFPLKIRLGVVGIFTINQYLDDGLFLLTTSTIQQINVNYTEVDNHTDAGQTEEKPNLVCPSSSMTHWN